MIGQTVTNLGCAIGHARLKDHVASMEGGLDAKVQEGGELSLRFIPQFSSILQFFLPFPPCYSSASVRLAFSGV